MPDNEICGPNLEVTGLSEKERERRRKRENMRRLGEIWKAREKDLIL
jgi:hypothetical protein